jgi:hypothetical protein
MTHNTWMDEKPEFTEECILVTAQKYNSGWEYSIYQIFKTSHEGIAYMGWFSDIHTEYGDLPDLKANKYLTMPLLK